MGGISLMRRERLFPASVTFFVTVVTVRAVTLSIRLGVGRLRDVSVGGTHVHHLVWGILLLLMVGYVWLAQVGTGSGQASLWASRVTAMLYGVGAALTLDEFALWLRLEDVYWTREGWESIEAVILFGVLLSVGAWSGRFLHAVMRGVTGAIGAH